MSNWREWVKQNPKKALWGSIAIGFIGIAIPNELEFLSSTLVVIGAIGVIVTLKVTRKPKGVNRQVTPAVSGAEVGAGVVFTPTKKVGKLIEFDHNAQQWRIPGKKTKNLVYSFSDVLEYELMEDADSVTKGGLGRAAVGGVLLGGVGAIVGGVTGGKKTKKIINSLKLKITVNNISSPVVWIDLINTPTKTASIFYEDAIKNAEEIISTFVVIKHQSNVDSNS